MQLTLKEKAVECRSLVNEPVRGEGLQRKAENRSESSLKIKPSNL